MLLGSALFIIKINRSTVAFLSYSSANVPILTLHKLFMLTKNQRGGDGSWITVNKLYPGLTWQQ